MPEIPFFKHKEHKDQEKADLLNAWISWGLALMKQGEYQEAISYFEDENMAERIGFGYGGVFSMPITPSKYTEEELQSIVDNCIMRCRIKIHPYLPITPEFVWSGGLNDPPHPSMDFARIEPVGPDAEPIPEKISQEVALAHAEVWINALQMMRGKPLMGTVQNSKIDAQMYLMQKGVMVTESFAARVEKYNPALNPNEAYFRSLLDQE